MQKQEQLNQIASEVNQCQRCILQQTRKKAVPGSGNAEAQIMFIGEGPGFNENEQGLPFVGAAGKFLDELLALINLRREDVYITNVVKCRPPSNRDPQVDELAACDEYLERQIQSINPKVIVTLGRFSMAKFLPTVKISMVHGSPKHVNGRLIVPMFHPAAALHQAALKPQIQADFKHLPELIMAEDKSSEENKSTIALPFFAVDDKSDQLKQMTSPIQERGQADPLQSTQLSLF